MKPHIKEIIIGFIVGLIANTSGTYLYIYFFSKQSLEDTLRAALINDFIGSLIALGAVLNLMAFFIYVKKRQYYRARGVILATVVAALVILILKFY